MNLEFHELANRFPLIEGEDFQKLIDDIDANGMQAPIILFEGKILDGRNRYRAACEIAKQRNEPEQYFYFCEDYNGGAPEAMSISLNVHRRHLTESQRAMLGVDLINAGGSIDPMTNNQVSEKVKVSNSAMKRAKLIEKNGIPEISKMVREGKLSTFAGHIISKLSAKEQKTLIENTPIAQLGVSAKLVKRKQMKLTDNVPINLVEISLCEKCLTGQGGICHTLGCALSHNKAPDTQLNSDSYNVLEQFENVKAKPNF